MLRQGRAASRLWCSQDSGATESVPLQPLLSHVEASTCRGQHDSVQHQQQQKQVERRSMEACPPSDSLKPMTSSSKSSSSSSSLCQASGRHGSQHVWQLRAVSRIWTGVLLLSLACMAIWAPAAHAATNAGDKAALLAFKSNITSDSGLLQTWSASTDPCGVGSGTPWVGISCTCNGSLPGDYDLLCGEEPVPSTDNGTRVLALNFGDILISEGRKLTGRISPDLDQLTELRLLNLRQNQLSGAIPYLGDLEFLANILLDSNQLTGTLPAWAGNLNNLTNLWLDSNNLTGSIPQDWCNLTVAPPMYPSNITISNNPRLCGTVPSCLSGRVDGFYGTSILSPANPSPLAGFCDSTPPVCSPDDGCGVFVPPYWTNPTQILFNFSDFQDPESGISRYMWGVGNGTSYPPTVITLRNYTGPNVTVDMSVGDRDFSNLVLHQVNYTPPGKTLIDGMDYRVFVQAINMGVPRTTTTIMSDQIEVTVEAPMLPPGGIISNTRQCTFSDNLDIDGGQLRICWAAFSSEGFNIRTYSYQILQYSPSYGTQVTPVTPVGLSTSTIVTGLQLEEAYTYFIKVFATNSAGITGEAQSQNFKINLPGSGLGGLKTGVVVAICIVVVVIALALITLIFFRWRYKKQKRAKKEHRGNMKLLKGTMFGLADYAGDPTKKHLDEIRNARELAFLITDLEGSTALAAADAKAFRHIQEIHDAVIREHIASHGGYEINTEGDAFYIAFKQVSSAVLCAMEIQYRLMETEWSRNILKMPGCREASNMHGEPAFKGPRVRMGIHWAVEGTVAHRLHMLTRHRVFTGPGFAVATELGDAASGGQVLLSQDAWLRLEGNMGQAAFPTLEQLGLFKLEAWPAPIWIYQVRQLLGRPLPRTFDPPRRLQLVSPGAGLRIVAPPVQVDTMPSNAPITFVAIFTKRAVPDPQAELPNAAAAKLYETLAMTAMQFAGYIYQALGPQGRYMLAFPSAMDGVRFCHGLQLSLLFTRWPNDLGHSGFEGPQEHGPDGRLIFRGPRVAMSIHNTTDYRVQSLEGQTSLPEVDYSGRGERLARVVADIIQGGQVVLTEAAWAHVQDQLPGQAQMIHLGTHRLSQDFPEPALLMEVMPSVLARRSFPPPASLACLEPGFRESPDPFFPMALVFLKVAKPKMVGLAEAANANSSEEEIRATVTAWHVGVGRASRLVRTLLGPYDGYECKEPEAGKFTLAFRTLEKAVRFGVSLQKQLLGLSWPKEILDWPECAEVRDPTSGVVLWRGLRIRLGIAWGKPSYRKPLNTGRADYYGALPNLAARVSALAAPGQVLIEGSGGWSGDPDWGTSQDGGLVESKPSQAGWLPIARTLSKTPTDEEPIELEQQGYFLLKGLDDPKLIYSALPASLRARSFEPPATAIRVHMDASRGKSRGSSMKTSSTESSHFFFPGLSQGSRLFTGLIEELAPGCMHSPPSMTEARGPQGSLPRPRAQSAGGVPAMQPPAATSAGIDLIARSHRSTTAPPPIRPQDVQGDPSSLSHKAKSMAARLRSAIRPSHQQRRTHDGSSLEAAAERQAEMIPQAARLRSRLELPSETESEALRHSSLTSRMPTSQLMATQLMTSSGTPSFTGSYGIPARADRQLRRSSVPSTLEHSDSALPFPWNLDSPHPSLGGSPGELNPEELTLGHRGRSFRRASMFPTILTDGPPPASFPLKPGLRSPPQAEAGGLSTLGEHQEAPLHHGGSGNQAAAGVDGHASADMTVIDNPLAAHLSGNEPCVAGTHPLSPLTADAPTPATLIVQDTGSPRHDEAPPPGQDLARTSVTFQPGGRLSGRSFSSENGNSLGTAQIAQLKSQGFHSQHMPTSGNIQQGPAASQPQPVIPGSSPLIPHRPPEHWPMPFPMVPPRSFPNSSSHQSANPVWGGLRPGRLGSHDCIPDSGARSTSSLQRSSPAWLLAESPPTESAIAVNNASLAAASEAQARPAHASRPAASAAGAPPPGIVRHSEAPSLQQAKAAGANADSIPPKSLHDRTSHEGSDGSSFAESTRHSRPGATCRPPSAIHRTGSHESAEYSHPSFGYMSGVSGNSNSSNQDHGRQPSGELSVSGGSVTLPEAPPAPAMSTPFGAQANLPAFDDTDDEHGDMPAFTKPQVEDELVTAASAAFAREVADLYLTGRRHSQPDSQPNGLQNIRETLRAQLNNGQQAPGSSPRGSIPVPAPMALNHKGSSSNSSHMSGPSLHSSSRLSRSHPAAASLLSQHISEEWSLPHETSLQQASQPLHPTGLPISDATSLSGQSSTDIPRPSTGRRSSDGTSAFGTSWERPPLRANDSAKWLSQLPAWRPDPSERARDAEMSSQEGSFTSPGRMRQDSASSSHEHAHPGWRQSLGSRISSHLRRRSPTGSASSSRQPNRLTRFSKPGGGEPSAVTRRKHGVLAAFRRSSPGQAGREVPAVSPDHNDADDLSEDDDFAGSHSSPILQRGVWSSQDHDSSLESRRATRSPERLPTALQTAPRKYTRTVSFETASSPPSEDRLDGSNLQDARTPLRPAEDSEPLHNL